MLNIVLFGPPGAGKGTQAQKIMDKYDLIHLSTGDILRSEVAAGTLLGLEAKRLMDQGILVPDEIVIDMISTKIDQYSEANGFIFDGFPRTVGQAEALDELLSDKGTSITCMLSLEVDEDELIERLLIRGRTDDQDESIIRNRITEYNTKTAPLIDYYSAQGKFISVYGIGSIEEIFSDLVQAIEEFQFKSIESKEENTYPDLMQETGTVTFNDKGEIVKVSEQLSVVSTNGSLSVSYSEEIPEQEVIEKRKAAVVKPAKKVAKKITKKAGVVKKTAAKSGKKKAVKKIVPAKKAAKKPAPAKKATKKVVKKLAKKVVKKSKKVAAKKSVSSRKPLKKTVKKASRKRTAVKKSAVKKKSVKKLSSKRARVKKVVKSKAIAKKRSKRR